MIWRLRVRNRAAKFLYEQGRNSYLGAWIFHVAAVMAWHLAYHLACQVAAMMACHVACAWRPEAFDLRFDTSSCGRLSAASAAASLLRDLRHGLGRHLECVPTHRAPQYPVARRPPIVSDWAYDDVWTDDFVSSVALSALTNQGRVAHAARLPTAHHAAA